MRTSNGVETVEARPIGNGWGEVNKANGLADGIFCFFEGAGQIIQLMLREYPYASGFQPCSDDTFTFMGLTIEVARIDSGGPAGRAAVGQQSKATSVFLRCFKGQIRAIHKIRRHIEAVFVINSAAPS